MSAFTDQEISYLRENKLGRLATKRAPMQVQRGPEQVAGRRIHH